MNSLPLKTSYHASILEEICGQFNAISYRAYQNGMEDNEKQKELDEFLKSKHLEDDFPLSFSVLSENFFKRHPYKKPDLLIDEVKVYLRSDLINFIHVGLKPYTDNSTCVLSSQSPFATLQPGLASQ